MTFEERLDRLAERHEALTQTVELAAGMQRDNEKLHKQNEQRVAQMMDAVTRLANIAAEHDERLEDLSH